LADEPGPPESSRGDSHAALHAAALDRLDSSTIPVRMIVWLRQAYRLSRRVDVNAGWDTVTG